MVYWYFVPLTVEYSVQFNSVQSLSHVRLFATPWTAALQTSLSISNSWSLFKLMSIESVDAIQPSHPLSSPSPPTFNLSQHQGLFQWVSSLHQMAKVLEFQLQHRSFQWLFRTDFLQDGLMGSSWSPRDYCCCCCWVAPVVSDSMRPHRRQPTRLPRPYSAIKLMKFYCLQQHDWAWRILMCVSLSVTSNSLRPHGP